MGYPAIRKDLDQLVEEWRSHRGAEITLLRGLDQVRVRISELQTQLNFQSDFLLELDGRTKARAKVSS